MASLNSLLANLIHFPSSVTDNPNTNPARAGQQRIMGLRSKWKRLESRAKKALRKVSFDGILAHRDFRKLF